MAKSTDLILLNATNSTEDNDFYAPENQQHPQETNILTADSNDDNRSISPSNIAIHFLTYHTYLLVSISSYAFVIFVLFKCFLNPAQPTNDNPPINEDNQQSVNRSNINRLLHQFLALLNLNFPLDGVIPRMLIRNFLDMRAIINQMVRIGVAEYENSGEIIDFSVSFSFDFDNDNSDDGNQNSINIIAAPDDNDIITDIDAIADQQNNDSSTSLEISEFSSSPSDDNSDDEQNTYSRRPFTFDNSTNFNTSSVFLQERTRMSLFDMGNINSGESLNNDETWKQILYPYNINSKDCSRFVVKEK